MATERILPVVLFSVPARGPGRRIVRPVPVPVPVVAATRLAPATARTATRLKEPLLGTPARAGMLIGVSAAVYAVTLAGVAGLQSGSDAELAAARQPLVAALADRRAANDGLEAELAAVNARLAPLGSAYDVTGQSVSAYEARLDTLATLVAEVQGSAAGVAARISLPQVTLHGTIPVGTASSGTSTAATSGTTAGATKVAASAATPVAASGTTTTTTTPKPPPTTTTTSASGKP